MNSEFIKNNEKYILIELNYVLPIKIQLLFVKSLMYIKYCADANTLVIFPMPLMALLPSLFFR